jgi:hypothetical protein
VKKPEPPLLSTFDVFRVAHKAIWLGTVEASDERDAIQRVASSLSDLAHCAGSGRIGSLIRPFYVTGWQAVEQFPPD